MLTLRFGLLLSFYPSSGFYLVLNFTPLAFKTLLLTVRLFFGLLSGFFFRLIAVFGFVLRFGRHFTQAVAFCRLLTSTFLDQLNVTERAKTAYNGKRTKRRCDHDTGAVFLHFLTANVAFFVFVIVCAFAELFTANVAGMILIRVCALAVYFTANVALVIPVRIRAAT